MRGKQQKSSHACSNIERQFKKLPKNKQLTERTRLRMLDYTFFIHSFLWASAKSFFFPPFTVPFFSIFAFSLFLLVCSFVCLLARFVFDLIARFQNVIG
jgi:hypothetical protein